MVTDSVLRIDSDDKGGKEGRLRTHSFCRAPITLNWSDFESQRAHSKLAASLMLGQILLTMAKSLRAFKLEKGPSLSLGLEARQLILYAN